MKTYIGSMITIFVVSLVMNLLTRGKQDKKTSSIYQFTVRPGSGLTLIGTIVSAFCLAMMVAAWFMGERTTFVYVGFGIFAALGLYIVIRTIPGADEIHINHDAITIQRAWFYKKHWDFSQIDFATMDHNGIHIYVKGKKRQAFVVDNMYTGMANFEKRLEHDKIEIREKTLTTEDAEKSKKMWNRISWLLVIGIVAVCALVYFLL